MCFSPMPAGYLPDYIAYIRSAGILFFFLWDMCIFQKYYPVFYRSGLVFADYEQIYCSGFGKCGYFSRLMLVV